MSTLLTSAEYPAIRAAIDVSLDSSSLPDSVIGLPIYLDSADLAIKARDPLWATRTSDDRTHLTNAAIYWTASLLAGALPTLTGEKELEYSYTRSAKDSALRAAELRSLAEAELNSYLEETPATADRPTMFAVASGRRGRW